MDLKWVVPVFLAGGVTSVAVLRLLQHAKARGLPFFKSDDPMYFDYNATTPIDPMVAKAMQPFLLEEFGNPSSPYTFGKRAKEALERARVQVSSLVNCDANELYFTSGATESLNWAIKGSVEPVLDSMDRPHIIVSAIEHVVVLEIAKYLEEQHGARLTVLPVDEKGRVRLYDIEKSLCKSTVLVSVMLANNETGTIQPIADICKLVRKYNSHIILHTDASQAVGKIPVDVKELGVDLLTIAGHKLYAPKGVGALYIGEHVRERVARLLHGAHGQERGMRAGTENVMLAVGLGKACEIAQTASVREHMRAMRDQLQAAICRLVDANVAGGDSVVRVNSDQNRLPNTLSISFRNVNSGLVLGAVVEVLAASAGSACHSGEAKVSRVLEAMHLAPEWAMGTIRLSVGKYTTPQQVEQCARILVDEIVKQINQRK